VSNAAYIVRDREPRIFTLREAQSLFPLVRRITMEAYHELQPVRRQLESTLPGNPKLPGVEAAYEDIVKRWVGKMERLGLVVKGLWLVDFDTGDGYVCWKFPELRLAYYHDYSEGFAGRRPLRDVIEELDPDWA
jgi:hypothetical protein